MLTSARGAGIKNEIYSGTSSPGAWGGRRGTRTQTHSEGPCPGESDRMQTHLCGEEEREKFITRQPPIGGKDDYDSENSWISDGLPSSSRRRRRGEGRGKGGEWRDKWSAMEVDVEVDGAKKEIKVKRRRGPERSP